MPEIDENGKVTVSAEEEKKKAEETINDISAYEIEEEIKETLEKEMKKQGYILNHYWDYDEESDTNIGTFMNKTFDVVTISFKGVEIEKK